jgi:DNA-binding Xre family transcriptional regulator
MQQPDPENVRPDGQSIRRRRHERAWPPKALIDAIGSASESSTGIKTTITPNELLGIEDRNEAIPYEMLCLIADGLHCDPVDILMIESEDEEEEDSDD